MEKIWLKSYPKNVPSEINLDKYNNLGHFFDKICNKYENDVAFESFGCGVTFTELRVYVDSFAGYLQKELNMTKGDVLGIMCPNLTQYVIVLFAALKLGIIVVNINPLFTPFELEKQLKESKPDTIFILENFVDKLINLDTKVNNVIVSKIGDFHGKLKSIYMNFINRIYNVKAYPEHTFAKFLDTLNYRYDAEFENLDSNTVAFLQYTGGTTGNPKAAILTHKNILANMLQGSYWVKPLLNDRNEVFVNPLPMYHIFSLASCFMFFSIGAKSILIANPKDTSMFLKQIKNSKLSIIIGVNTLFDLLIRTTGFKKTDFSNLKVSLAGGMPVNEDVAKRWEKVTNCHILEAYGLTESSPAVCVNPLTTTEFNSSIGLPLPSTEVSIRQEDGTELPINQIGELWVKGPQVMQGYFNKPNETNLVLQDDWLKTGDMALMDEKGFVYIKDRIKDLIIVSGFNVYPSEIENVLLRHPQIQHAAVIGEKYKYTESIVAFICSDISKEEVLEHCRSYLTNYKIPRKIIFIDSMPKTSIGKISKAKLRKISASHALTNIE